MKLFERGTIHFMVFSFTYLLIGSSSPLYDGQMLFHLHLSDGTPIPGIADNDEPIVSLRKTHVTNITTLPDQSKSSEEFILQTTDDQSQNSPLVPFVSATFNELYYTPTEVYPSTSPSHLEGLDSYDVHPSTRSYGVRRLSSDVDESHSLPEIEIRLSSPTTSSEIYPSTHVDDSFRDNNEISLDSHFYLYASTIDVFSPESPISDRPRLVLATSVDEMNEEMSSRFTQTQENSPPSRQSSADWKSISSSVNGLSSLDSGVTASNKEMEFQSVTSEFSEGYSTPIQSSVIEKTTPRLTSQVTENASFDLQVESTENYSFATTLNSAIRHEATLTPIVETQLPNSIKSNSNHSTLDKFHSASLFVTEGVSPVDMFVTQISNQTEAGSLRAEVFSTSFLEDGQEFSFFSST